MDNVYDYINDFIRTTTAGTWSYPGMTLKPISANVLGRAWMTRPFKKSGTISASSASIWK